MHTFSARWIILMVILSSLFGLPDSKAQDKLIEGSIINSESFEPLPFATILIQGTHVSTASNFNGRFILSVPKNYLDSILVCSYVGFKDFRIKTGQFVNKSEIKLLRDIIELKNLEVRPWKPWDYVQAALTNVSQNYSPEPYLSEGYYSEYLTENDSFLKYTEAVVQTYNPIYGDTAKSHSHLIQARKRNDLGQFKFMREKIDKKIQKELKKHKDSINAETPKNIDDAILKSSFGGPDRILGLDPIRDNPNYINPENEKEFRYNIDGYTSYHDEDIIIIGYESKGHIKHQKISGKIYISLKKFAIVAIDYESRIIIPDVVRPLIFALGFGITDPVISGKIHYKPMNNRWYLNDIAIDGAVRVTRMKLFSKNDQSWFKFKQALINTDYNFDGIKPIPREQWLNTRKPLEEQVIEDPVFWKNYHVARPMD